MFFFLDGLRGVAWAFLPVGLTVLTIGLALSATQQQSRDSDGDTGGTTKSEGLGDD